MKIRSDERDTCNVPWGLLHCIGLSIFVTASNNYNYVNVITLIKAALNNLKSTFSMFSVFCIVGRSDC